MRHKREYAITGFHNSAAEAFASIRVLAARHERYLLLRYAGKSKHHARNVGRAAYRLFQISLYEPGFAIVSEFFGGRAFNTCDYMLPPVPQAASFPLYHGMASAQ